RFNMLEGARGGARGFNSHLFEFARTLLRASEELPKPNGERLHEYQDSELDSLKDTLFSQEPIYPEFETMKLAHSLTFLANRLGANSDLVKKVLAGKSPQERAFELVSGTKLKDPEARKKLFEGGKVAVSGARDPMIELARAVDPTARELRKVVEAEEEVKQ